MARGYICVKMRDNWAQDAVINEFCDNNFVRIIYETKDGELSDYIHKENLAPKFTPEDIKIFDHSKADAPKKC